ncbi:hypothetical protein ABZ816_08315 [Actinosynnema sp. NPDC047251]|uniref:Uncharacterized protein n=1 Tax=Saccharothrix espanaensis (strain ATCC 51144 / DSM 44229 / JCM 9112 / NBRC 15066 / NRRL 15764) TaxID=1179773 RepID=K0JRW5_SACES|nr:hypothetical protein [Saccharothrix espanaensis]CCH27539.1 hypothetical protein BN6_02060 [Saccharothrix espanaensis DSM 44229]
MTAAPPPREPRTWPALLHRLSTAWAPLLRLLAALALAVSIILAALWLLPEVTVHIGPVGVERPGPGRPLAVRRDG